MNPMTDDSLELFIFSYNRNTIVPLIFITRLVLRLPSSSSPKSCIVYFDLIICAFSTIDEFLQFLGILSNSFDFSPTHNFSSSYLLLLVFFFFTSDSICQGTQISTHRLLEYPRLATLSIHIGRFSFSLYIPLRPPLLLPFHVCFHRIPNRFPLVSPCLGVTVKFFRIHYFRL